MTEAYLPETAAQEDSARLAPIGRWLAETLVAERERWVLWLPVAVGTGVGVYFALPSEPSGWLGAAVLLPLVAALVLSRRQRPPVPAIFAGLIALCLGFTVAQVRTLTVAAPVLAERIGPLAVSGRVVAVEPRGHGQRLVLDEVRIPALDPQDTPRNVRVSVSARDVRVQPGERIGLRAVLSPPPPPVAPGAFDFQRQSYFRGLGAVGFAYGGPELLEPMGNDWSLPLAVADLRLAIGERVAARLPGPEGAVARALMTGERGAIPEPVLEAMRDSGMAHLLAISGLHIGLVAGILFFGARALMALIPPLALRYPIKKIAAALGILGALAYAAIAGAPVPTQRAFLMIGLVLFAVLIDRRGLGIRTVAWAALAILVWRPESLLGASFQLSFAAVTALVAIYEEIGGFRAGRLPRPRGPLRRLAAYPGGVALSTLIAGSVTAPFAIFHFNRLAVFGLAANLGAVPVTALWIMPWAVLAFLLMPFGLEGLALAPMGWGIGLVVEIAETVAGWPGAVTLLPAMPVWGLVFVTLGGLWLLLWRRRWRWAGGPLIAAGMASLALVTPPDILVDDKGELLAVRMADGDLAVSTLRTGRFDREVWLRRDGQDGHPAKWPAEGVSADGRMACDGMGCIYRAAGHTVALVRETGALAEDCRAADVIVAAVPVRRTCPSAKVVVDRFDVWRNGAHALWLDGPEVRVESVNRSRGARPWVPKR